jgi:hypothetical protein
MAAATLSQAAPAYNRAVSSTELRGSCLCGAVTFAAATPSLFCCHCHCRWCRRAHGAAFVTWVGVAEDRFEITAGDAELRWYQSTPQSRRGFCGRCGSTMLFQSSASPGEIHIAAACLESELDRQPSGHIFIDHKVAWIELAGDLPEISGDSDSLAAYRDIGK